MRATALAVVLLAGLAGCISVGGRGAPAVMRVHALDGAPLPKTARTPFPGRTVAVHRFAARKRFDERVVRREADGTVSLLETERWAEPPADAVTDAVREALARSGLFDGVFDAGEAHTASWELDGYVLDCDVVRSASGPWKARVRLRLDLAASSGGTLLATGVYTGEADLPGASTDGLGAALGVALGAALDGALAAWPH